MRKYTVFFVGDIFLRIEVISTFYLDIFFFLHDEAMHNQMFDIIELITKVNSCRWLLPAFFRFFNSNESFSRAYSTYDDRHLCVCANESKTIWMYQYQNSFEYSKIELTCDNSIRCLFIRTLLFAYSNFIFSSLHLKIV